jgi:hypothetical protein
MKKISRAAGTWKRVLLAVVAIDEKSLEASNQLGFTWNKKFRFKGVSLRHLQLVYPTFNMNRRTLERCLRDMAEFGLILESFDSENGIPRWAPTESSRKRVKELKIHDDARKREVDFEDILKEVSIYIYRFDDFEVEDY